MQLFTQPPYNEDKLVALCINGDRKAQRQFYERFSKKMFVIALRYSKTTFEAEDILQEAFVNIFQHIGEFKGSSTLEYWVKRVVVNTALKQNRKFLEKMHMDDVTMMSEDPSEELTLSDYNFQQLLAFIQQLPTGFRTIFNLYAIEGYKHHEIAEMLDITEGTSKSQYARAKALLQKMIAKDEDKVYERQR
jgi:RNA polymerase sigma factor (sigma-70 family)